MSSISYGYMKVKTRYKGILVDKHIYTHTQLSKYYEQRLTTGMNGYFQ